MELQVAFSCSACYLFCTDLLDDGTTASRINAHARSAVFAPSCIEPSEFARCPGQAWRREFAKAGSLLLASCRKDEARPMLLKSPQELGFESHAMGALPSKRLEQGEICSELRSLESKSY